MTDTYSAHDHANNNQAEIMVSSECACFGCYAVFPAHEVTRWTNSTAWCPKCEAFGTMLGDASGLSLTREFLESVHDHWIGPQEWLDELAGQTNKVATAFYKPADGIADARKKRPWWKFW